MTIVFVVAVLVTWFVLARLRWGRYLYATGGNQEAARLSGVPISRTLVLAYAYSGLFAAVAGILFERLLRNGRMQVMGLVFGLLALSSMTAWSLARADTWKDEISLFSGMTRSSPNDSTGYKNLGMALTRAGRWIPAMDAFRRQTEMEPDNAVAFADLGATAGNARRWKEARDAYRKALVLKADMPHALHGLCLASLYLKDVPSAVTAWEELRRLNPSLAEGLAVVAERDFKVRMPG